MLAAVLLLFCEPFFAPFYCVYLYAGATDALDGMLARRLGVNTVSGARLDSIADIMFAAAALYRIVPVVPWSMWMLLWAAGVALLRLANLCIGLIKYRSAPFLHTWLNKLTGGLLFLFPALYGLLGLTGTAWLLGVAATLASVEELIVTLTADTLDRDRRGLFFRLRRR